MTKLSILMTFRQALTLGANNVRLILLLAFLGAIPGVLLTFAVAYSGKYASGFISFLLLIILVVTGSMMSASILGVLKAPSSERRTWKVIKESIQAYTRSLIGLSILLSIIAIAITIPITAIVLAFSTVVPTAQAHYVTQMIVALIAILYIVFVKYALARPLIVLENLNAGDALKKSWAMTRGRFWYVLGCYILLGTAQYLISSVIGLFTSVDGLNIVAIINQLFGSVMECAWNLVAWCMYWQIKSADVPPFILSPPASPSASQSA